MNLYHIDYVNEESGFHSRYVMHARSIAVARNRAERYIPGHLNGMRLNGVWQTSIRQMLRRFNCADYLCLDLLGLPGGTRYLVDAPDFNAPLARRSVSSIMRSLYAN